MALVARERLLRRRPAKKKDADVAEDGEHERGEDGVSKTQFDIEGRVAMAIRIERREKGNAEGKTAGQVTGDLIVQVVTARRGQKSTDSAQRADVVVAHRGEVIVADGALQQRMRKRVSRTQKRVDNVADRQNEGKRKSAEPHRPAHEVVGEHSRVFRRWRQRKAALHKQKYRAEAG